MFKPDRHVRIERWELGDTIPIYGAELIGIRWLWHW